MTPAFVLGPLLVAHALGSTLEATLPQRDTHHGGVTVHAVARPRADGTVTARLDVKAEGATQTIDLRPRAMSPEMLVGSVQIVDANFDGHPDIVVLREFGAKSSRTPERSEGSVANVEWGQSDVYLFDPRSRRFSNASPLARELGRLSNVTFDALHQRITAHDIGPSHPSRQVYTLAGGGLRLAESCTFLNDRDEHVGTLVRSRLVGGAVRSSFTKVSLGPTDVDPCGL